MPVYRLGKDLVFPPPEVAEPTGLLAVGGDLEPERLLLAYSLGIFPWYEERQPILWHSPDPRTVLVPSQLRVSRSLRKAIHGRPFDLKLDTAFERVVRACAEVARPGATGTWITPDMIRAYGRLHAQGYAHSAESWAGDELVGGLYGVSLGGCFFGESMFALRSDASKVAFVALVRQLEAWGFDLVDCQVHTEHLARFGAVECSRRRFGEVLAEALAKKTCRGVWSFDPEILTALPDAAV
ncbi:MAG: leucyl/phenylalanyl-tRNA--protein transferase [Myxococcales bacterium]|nr:leucyl/phenylalanyl-tRNA--protein transferase [Myxococcales bacterium]